MNDAINLFDYTDFRGYLNDAFARRKSENPGFSLRMVASKLGCNAGFFNRVMKGERSLSPHLSLALADFLKLNAKQRRYFELLVGFTQAKMQSEKDHFFRQLDRLRFTKVKETVSAQHALYAEWFFIVLRELINTVPCNDTSDATCRALAKQFVPSVTPDQVRQALDTLDRLGLLKRKPNGTFTVRERFITSGTEIPQVVVNRVLLQFLNLARDAVDRFPRPERSLSMLTFSVSESGYRKIREKLDDYRRELLSLVSEETEGVDRVYHLNLHLFPVSKPYGERRK